MKGRGCWSEVRHLPEAASPNLGKIKNGHSPESSLYSTAGSEAMCLFLCLFLSLPISLPPSVPCLCIIMLKQYLLALPVLLFSFVNSFNNFTSLKRENKEAPDSLATWTPGAGGISDQLLSHPIPQTHGFINALSSALDCHGASSVIVYFR